MAGLPISSKWSKSGATPTKAVHERLIPSWKRADCEKIKGDIKNRTSLRIIEIPPLKDPVMLDRLLNAMHTKSATTVTQVILGAEISPWKHVDYEKMRAVIQNRASLRIIEIPSINAPETAKLPDNSKYFKSGVTVTQVIRQNQSRMISDRVWEICWIWRALNTLW